MTVFISFKENEGWVSEWIVGEGVAQPVDGEHRGAAWAFRPQTPCTFFLPALPGRLCPSPLGVVASVDYDFNPGPVLMWGIGRPEATGIWVPLPQILQH